MKITAYYSHLNGLEYLLVHKPHLWDEIREVIAQVDAESCKTKISDEERTRGRVFYSPPELNKAMKRGFSAFDWGERRVNYYVTDDPFLTRRIMNLPRNEQKQIISQAGKVPFASYNQTDFVKDRCMVEVQFGKYSFIAHDLFVKHMAFYTTDHMDVGIEVLPMKAMQTQMSSGVPYYEGALYDLIRQGKGVPHVPLVMVGVEPEAPVDATVIREEASLEEKAIESGAHLREDE